MATKSKFAGMGNSEQYHAMVGKRFGNAATKHDPRPRRQRTRRDTKRIAIRHDQDGS